MGIKEIKRRLSHDIGIDLGTANTLVYIKGVGIIINEPSVVAINRKSKQVVAIGTKAKAMIGRTPKGIQAARPLVDGVVSNYEITEHMLRYFIDKAHQEHRVLWAHPRVVIGLPSGVTEVEKRAVEQAAKSAGARKVFLIEEPMAAALGTHLPVKDARGSMLIDIGGGTTEVAVLSLGGIVVSKSLRIAGDEITESIMQFARDEHNLYIGEATAETIKLTIGRVFPSSKTKKMTVRGRNLISGLPEEIKLSNDHLRSTLSKQVRPIIEAIKATLEESPPELAADISEDGVMLVGGGSQLKGLDKLIEQETNLRVKVPKNALSAVVEGCGMVLDDVESLREILVKTGYQA